MTKEMVYEQGNSSPTSHGFSSTFANRIFSDVAGDITIVVDKESFLLHKFPLVARSGKIRKLVADSKNTSNLVLKNFPGGPETFELTAKFCYGVNFEITTSNVAPLRCASHYLEMTEDHREENLVQRTETYLHKVAFQSLEKSVEVLSTCEALQPLADVIKIPERCIDSIIKIACREQLVSGLSRLDFNEGSFRVSRDPPLEWWVEDLSNLGIDFYRRVLISMMQSGARTDSIIASLIHYAQTSLKGIGKPHIMNPARTNNSASLSAENGQKTIVESLVSLLPAEKSFPVPLTFLFGMLKIAIMVDASLACRLELERRIAFKLENALLDDLLIPSVQRGNSLFDVDTIHRILVHFVQRIEDEENEEESGYESEGGGIIACSGHGSLIKVGSLIDAYLAEIAPDPCLSLAKFVAVIEILPDYARVVDDGLYRAIDIYLKAHPTLTEQECKNLCKYIDCQKLSQEACNHAAQNDRLPVHVVVRVLYSEQLRLKDSLCLNSVEGLLSQKICSGVQSAAMSPRDTYASLRRENRELKLEISRMRVRLSDLEKEQVAMKRGMIMAMEDKSNHARTLLTSISKGFVRFGKKGKVPEGGKKNAAKSKRYSLS